MRHLDEDDLAAIYYGEQGSADHLAHLDACEACRDRSGALAEFLDALRQIEVPEPPAGFEEAVWRRIEWRMSARRESVSRLPWLALAASLLLVAFLLGRLVESRAPGLQPLTAGAGAVDRGDPNRVYVAFVDDHLDRTQMVLLELTNADAGDFGGFSGRASDLVRDNRLARLSDPDPAIASLLDSIEPTLVELSHASAGSDTEALGRIRRRLEQNGLLLRIRVARTGLGERTSTRPPKGRSL